MHGKALYAVPYSFTDFQTITGRSVYRNLLALIAERYAGYQSRQGPGANAVTVTLDGAPVALGPDGRFEVSAPLAAAGSATLAVRTAAGDATSRTVP